LDDIVAMETHAGPKGSAIASYSYERSGLHEPLEGSIPIGFRLSLIDQVLASPNQNNRSQYLGRFHAENHRYSVLVGFGENPVLSSCPYLSMIAVQCDSPELGRKSKGFILQSAHGANCYSPQGLRDFRQRIESQHDNNLLNCYRILMGMFNILHETTVISADNRAFPDKAEKLLQPRQMELMLRVLYVDPAKAVKAFSPDLFKREDDLGIERLFSNENFIGDIDRNELIDSHTWPQDVTKPTLVDFIQLLEQLELSGLNPKDDKGLRTFVSVIHEMRYDIFALIHQCEVIGLLKSNTDLKAQPGDMHTPRRGVTYDALGKCRVTSKIKGFRLTESIYVDSVDRPGKDPDECGPRAECLHLKCK